MADAADPALVSLVIAARSGEALVSCLESFTRIDDGRLEIIVAECAGAGTPDVILAKCPNVRVLHFDERQPTPRLRAAGLRAARGEIVAMTTDRCRADADWLRALRRAHESPVAAVGGAIAFESGATAIDRAVFICEYGRYMPPFEAGPSVDLPGQNVSYTRAALAAIDDLVDAATWEPLWHWRMHARGLRLVRDPARLVWMLRRFTLRGFLAERYHYSRAFAGQRVAGRSPLVRAIFAAGALLLPPLILARVIRQVPSKRGHVREWLAALPLVALFTIPWAAGECVGALAGPGASADRVD